MLDIKTKIKKEDVVFGHPLFFASSNIQKLCFLLIRFKNDVLTTYRFLLYKKVNS